MPFILFVMILFSSTTPCLANFSYHIQSRDIVFCCKKSCFSCSCFFYTFFSKLCCNASSSMILINSHPTKPCFPIQGVFKSAEAYNYVILQGNENLIFFKPAIYYIEYIILRIILSQELLYIQRVLFCGRIDFMNITRVKNITC